MKPFYIGIDPGKSGGIVGLTNGKINVIDKMPQTPKDIWDYFIYLGFPNMINKEITYVCIEAVHSMPTDGVRSAFTFGHHVGQLDMVFAALNIIPLRVRPSEWQSSFGIQREKGESKYVYKGRLVELAQRLCRADERNKMTRATADAYLIALYISKNLSKYQEGDNVNEKGRKGVVSSEDN